MRRLTLTSVVLVSLACATQEEPRPPTSQPPAQQLDPKPEVKERQPEPEPEPQPIPVDVVVSSVHIRQDCPDAPAAAPAAEAEAKGAVAPQLLGDREYPPACGQSRVQLSFTSRAQRPVAVTVKGARMIPDGPGTAIVLSTRSPSLWDAAGGYKPWDELVQVGKSAASYKLGAKDWNAVDRMVGFLYFLELEVEIGGETQTIKSQVFTPEPEEQTPVT
ncbi:MAG: hypothetical protein JKY37_16025 [Nannocystaceae bacterium]|nr:hypothetical protein [Nannocystaceae bacterium]